MLARLFARQDRLSALSRRPDRDAFVRALFDGDVIVLTTLESEGLDAANLTEDALLSEIEQAAKDLSERQSFQPFLYAVGESWCLPFFSSEEHVQAF